MTSIFECDYVVVGAGINGTWTAAHLSERGCKTILVDQFPLPHARGSSHGATRIIRKAYPQDLLRFMMTDAFRQWRSLEQQTGTELIRNLGMLAFSTKNAPFLSEIVKGFKKDGNDNYILHDEQQLVDNYPIIKSDERNLVGCFDKEAGFIKAEKALELTREKAMKSGCEILDCFEVSRIFPINSNHVLLKEEGRQKRQIHAKGLVICAGPWTNKLLKSINFELPLTVQKIPVFYWKYQKFFDCPFVFKEIEAEIYGIPEYEYPGLVKICSHRGIPVDPDVRDEVDTTPIKKLLQNIFEQRLPTIEREPSIEEPCLYTCTPDQVHILEAHPAHKNIVFGAGFSGTGFKLSPVTGEILADLVMNLKPKYDISPFSSKRFKNVAKI